MERIKAIFRCKWTKYAVATFIFVVWLCFIDTNNLGVLIRTNRHIRDQKDEIRQLEEEIARKETRYRQLTSEKDSLEKFAREEYSFHERGEDVYFIKKID